MLRGSARRVSSSLAAYNFDALFALDGSKGGRSCVLSLLCLTRGSAAPPDLRQTPFTTGSSPLLGSL